MPFVLDASVALAWYFEDEPSEYASRVLNRIKEDPAIAPSIWPLEMANALAVARRTGRIADAQIRRTVSGIERLGIAVLEITVTVALGPLLERAVATGLTAYDAAYLELALREGVPLATLDRRFAAAAKRLGVDLLE